MTYRSKSEKMNVGQYSQGDTNTREGRLLLRLFLPLLAEFQQKNETVFFS